MSLVLSLWKGVLENGYRPPMPVIVSEVAARYDLSVPDLKGDETSRRYSLPRQEAYATMFAHGYNKSQIGRFMGGRHYTTVIHGLLAHEARKIAA